MSDSLNTLRADILAEVARSGSRDALEAVRVAALG